MKLIHSVGYYPPRSESPPVRVEIRFDADAVDRSGPLPQWPFAVEVYTNDFRGVALAVSGSIEALTESDARLRVYEEAIETIAQLLAQRIAAGAKGHQ